MSTKLCPTCRRPLAEEGKYTPGDEFCDGDNMPQDPGALWSCAQAAGRRADKAESLLAIIQEMTKSRYIQRFGNISAVSAIRRHLREGAVDDRWQLKVDLTSYRGLLSRLAKPCRVLVDATLVGHPNLGLSRRAVKVYYSDPSFVEGEAALLEAEEFLRTHTL